MQAPDHSGKIYGRQFRCWPHSKPTQHFRQVQPTDKSGKCNEFRTNQQQPGKKEAILPPAKEVPSESERKRQRSWCVKDETVANHRTSYLMVINYNRWMLDTSLVLGPVHGVTTERTRTRRIDSPRTTTTGRIWFVLLGSQEDHRNWEITWKISKLRDRVGSFGIQIMVGRPQICCRGIRGHMSSSFLWVSYFVIFQKAFKCRNIDRNYSKTNHWLAKQSTQSSCTLPPPFTANRMLWTGIGSWAPQGSYELYRLCTATGRLSMHDLNANTLRYQRPTWLVVRLYHVGRGQVLWASDSIPCRP